MTLSRLWGLIIEAKTQEKPCWTSENHGFKVQLYEGDKPQFCRSIILFGERAHAMRICRQDWDRVIEKACDIANATENDHDPMYEVRVEGMMALLDELAAKYGPQSRILATRADYLESCSERRVLYEQALDLARKAHDQQEIAEIRDSINQLTEEERAEQGAAPNGGPATKLGNSEGTEGPPSVS